MLEDMLFKLVALEDSGGLFMPNNCLIVCMVDRRRTPILRSPVAVDVESATNSFRELS